MPLFFLSLSELLEEIAATRSRLQMTLLVADFLKKLHEDEVELVVSLILGRAFPKWSKRTLNISWTILSQILQRLSGADWADFAEAFRGTGDVESAVEAVFEKNKPKRQMILFEHPLTILEVRRNLDAIADAEGAGSRQKKDHLITALLSRASPLEAKYLVKVFVGEMRTGFYEGLMEQAVARAFDVPLPMVQQANMAVGDIGEVAATIKAEGKESLQKIAFKIFRPVKPMLAQVADVVDTALKAHGGETAFEYKYDGARVQIHKFDGEVRIFSRSLSNVTTSLPEIIDTVQRNVAASEAILEGEVVAVDSAGVPIPFQHLMRRFRRIRGVIELAKQVPLRLYLFDLLYLDGENLIQRPYMQRRQILSENVGKISLTTQLVTNSKEKAEAFLDAAMAAGHEGLMAKKLDSFYTPGTRGKRWFKIKQVLETLDLVITAAEYGYGRRHDWLSDYYLSARDEKTGEFLTLGKTFKGLTDVELTDMTRRLKNISLRQEGNKVTVLPKIVVEVTYNEIQKSPRYKSEMALRFARITRIRDDKTVEDADTIQRVRTIYEQQFAKKGRYKTAPQ